MKHRKWIALLTALCLALPLGALAAEADTELEGLVTELVDGGFIMEDRDLGTVLVNVDDTTVRDGILAEGEMEVGQYVIVAYDGRLTRSIPPQAHADRVGCYVLNGTVSEFLENGVLLTGDEVFGDVIVRLNGSVPHIYRDMPITVYYDGVMALSLPGQVNARYVIVPELTGVVSEKDGEGFTLTDESGQSYRVLLGGDTLTGMLSASVEKAENGEAGNAQEAQPEAAGTAQEPDETHEPEENPTQEAAAPPTLEWGDGDYVTVYYNGMMTKSNPPQLTALEVLVVRE